MVAPNKICLLMIPIVAFMLIAPNANAMNEIVDIIHVRDLWTAEWMAPNGTLMHGVTGKGVGVAIIDTGIDGTHPDFAGRLVYNGKYVPGVGWVPIIESDTLVGHGTACAGLAGGSGLSSGGSYKGVAPECNLIGLSSEIGMMCIFEEYADKWVYENAEKYNIRAVSNSYGKPYVPLSDEFGSILEKNVLYIFCAGNAGGDGTSDLTANYNHPAGAVLVGGSLKNGSIWSASSRGCKDDVSSWISVVSPQNNIVVPISKAGVLVNANVVSYNTEENIQLLLKGYVRSPTGGTSASTPLVAGVAALMFQVNPNLTPAQAKKILELTADANFGEYDETGWFAGYGLVNATRAVAVSHYMALRPESTIAEALQYHRINWNGAILVLNPSPLPEIIENKRAQFNDGIEEEIRNFPDAYTYGIEENLLRLYFNDDYTLSDVPPEEGNEKWIKLAMQQPNIFKIKLSEKFLLSQGRRSGYLCLYLATDSVSLSLNGGIVGPTYYAELLKYGNAIWSGSTAHYNFNSTILPNEIHSENLDMYIQIGDDVVFNQNDEIEIRITTYYTSTNSTVGNVYIMSGVDHPSGIKFITLPSEKKSIGDEIKESISNLIPGFESTAALAIISATTFASFLRNRKSRDKK